MVTLNKTRTLKDVSGKMRALSVDLEIISARPTQKDVRDLIRQVIEIRAHLAAVETALVQEDYMERVSKTKIEGL